jgi:hypothetical protein
MTEAANNKHLYEQSSSREKVIEHLFVGELLRNMWCSGFHQVEVLRSEFDASGYDVVIDCNGIMRHIQLKSSYLGAKTSRQKINIALSSKPSGCVVWIFFNKNNLSLEKYKWFGNLPSLPLPDLGHKTAKHTKGNSLGVKLDRPNIREISATKFELVDTMDDLIYKLFGQKRELRLLEKAA